MSDFDGYELAVGSVKGIRSWNVDALGRLVGAAGHVWTPAEQVAACKSPGTLYMSSMSQWINMKLPDDSYEMPKPPPHDLGRCSCGFYAYYDGSTSFHKPGWVDGVIGGWGKTVVGTKGFRCEKAQLLALAIPGSGKWRRWMPTLNGAFFGWFALKSVMAAMDGHWWSFAIYVLGALINLAGLILNLRHPAGMNRAREKLLRRNYPEVAFYGSKRAMLKAWPLDRGYEPVKPHPDTDPEFWTRSAS